jgi:ketosteroid isomerase-like protein
VINAFASGETFPMRGTEHLDVSLAGNEVHANFRVTNIYRREGSEWKMVHHHTDLNPTIVETLSRLET